MPAQKQPDQGTLTTKGPEGQPLAKPKPLKTLLTWRAPVRPFKRRSREYSSTLAAIVFLVLIILVFLKEWFLIITIIALAFVSYIMATIEPGETEHELTTRGIKTGGQNYAYPDLGRFWFTEKWGQKILHVETRLPFPRQLMMLLAGTSQAKLKEILSEYLLFEEPEKAWIDNASEWLSRRVPLEKA